MLTAVAIAAPAAAAPRPGLSLTKLEPYYVCVVCHEPLNVAQAPEAEQERSTLSSLIGKGETKAQIDSGMVSQYGTSVLGVPKAQGFNAVLYILPPVALLAGIASLAVLLPRWRRRGRDAAALDAPVDPALDAAEAKRLDEELARYDG
jgi:cytochrome c-type biogenesis protein CcmH/NrfF